MATDNFCTAYEKLTAAANGAADRQEENTLYDLRRVLCIAATPMAAQWSTKVDDVVAYVKAGNYSGTDDAARRIWNKRWYQGGVDDETQDRAVPVSQAGMESQ